MGGMICESKRKLKGIKNRKGHVSAIKGSRASV